jgi:hypothetical protein
MADDWTGGICIALLARRLTPRQAARVKYRTANLRACADAESLAYSDAMTRNDIAHQWFCFCLDAVARAADEQQED